MISIQSSLSELERSHQMRTAVLEAYTLAMLLVACGGLIVTLVGVALLHRGAQESLNVRGAFLEVLGDLPGLEELKGSGLLDHRLPPGFAVPMPSDDPQLRDDEDPLEPGDLDLGLAPPPERIEE